MGCDCLGLQRIGTGNRHGMDDIGVTQGRGMVQIDAQGDVRISAGGQEDANHFSMAISGGSPQRGAAAGFYVGAGGKGCRDHAGLSGDGSFKQHVFALSHAAMVAPATHHVKRERAAYSILWP